MSCSAKPSSFAVAATSRRAGKLSAAHVAIAAGITSSVIVQVFIWTQFIFEHRGGGARALPALASLQDRRRTSKIHESRNGQSQRRWRKNSVAPPNPICDTRGVSSHFNPGKRRRMFHFHGHATEFPVEIKPGSVRVPAA